MLGLGIKSKQKISTVVIVLFLLFYFTRTFIYSLRWRFSSLSYYFKSTLGQLLLIYNFCCINKFVFRNFELTEYHIFTKQTVYFISLTFYNNRKAHLKS